MRWDAGCIVVPVLNTLLLGTLGLEGMTVGALEASCGSCARLSHHPLQYLNSFTPCYSEVLLMISDGSPYLLDSQLNFLDSRLKVSSIDSLEVETAKPTSDGGLRTVHNVVGMVPLKPVGNPDIEPRRHSRRPCVPASVTREQLPHELHFACIGDRLLVKVRRHRATNFAFE